MTLPDPQWRIKTRPCPFFQKGKCVFGSSCNFVHSSNSQWSPHEPTLIERDYTPHTKSPTSPTTSTSSSSDSFPSLRSSHRSPRFSDLLLALKDVIGEENAAENDNNKKGSNPLHELTSDDPHLNLLSPVSDLQLAGLRSDTTFDGDDSIDSSYSNWSWHTPGPLVLSPPRSPSVSSTFDMFPSPFNPAARLVSPRLTAFSRIPPSPSGSTSSGQTSPQFSEEGIPIDTTLDSPPLHHYDDVDRETDDDNDDDHEEQTTRPMARPLSSESDNYDLSALGRRSLELPEEYPDGESTSRWDAVDNATAVFLGPPSQEEVRAAMSRSAGSHSQFTISPTEEFIVEEIPSASSEDLERPLPPSTPPGLPPNSAMEDFDADQTIDVEQDVTAKLAYLSDAFPPVKSPSRQQTDDTINSLYAAYDEENHDEDEDMDPEPSHYIVPFSDSDLHTPVTPRRERVFSPPLHNNPYRQHLSTPGSHSSPVEKEIERTSPSSQVVPYLTPPPSGAALPRQRSRSGTLRASDDSPLSAYSPSPFDAVKDEDLVSSPEEELDVNVPFGRSFSRSPTSSSLGEPPVSPTRSLLHSSDHQDDDDEDEQTTGDDITSFPPYRTSFSAKPAGGGLRPLRLSTILTPTSPSYIFSPSTSAHSSKVYTPPSLSSRNRILSKIKHSPSYSEQTRKASNVFRPNIAHAHRPSSTTNYDYYDEPPRSAPPFLRPQSPRTPTFAQPGIPEAERQTRSASVLDHRPSYSFSYEAHTDDEEDEDDTRDYTIRRPILPPLRSAPVSNTQSPHSLRRQSSSFSLSAHTLSRKSSAFSLSTPKPTLLFAIASDNPEEVRTVLQKGDVDLNGSVGPMGQSALEFALGNESLTKKLEIVKVLLSYGAKPPQPDAPEMENADAATRYYLSLASSSLTQRITTLLQRSQTPTFAQLSRVRHEMIGQERALEQLAKALSVHSSSRVTSRSKAPLVILMCGPSGLGKSLLASKFGALLECPTHTVNMTTLRSASDLWQTYSMTVTDSSKPRLTLLEYLTENEGKRCVVVLDEFEKCEDMKILWSLLVPWEFGRCSFEGNSLNIDVSNVIWLATSNIGHDLVPQFFAERSIVDRSVSRDEYVEVMKRVRPVVSDLIGVSLLSRVTTILPFVPFTREEKKAIGMEALHSFGTDILDNPSPRELEKIVDDAIAKEGDVEDARSLYRAVSNCLVDMV